MKLGPDMYPLNTFNIPNYEGVNKWMGRGRIQKTTRKCHVIKRILTFASSETNSDNAKEKLMWAISESSIGSSGSPLDPSLWPYRRENRCLQKRLKFCKSDLFFNLHNEKTLFSIKNKRKSVFFLIFTIKLFSTALSNLTAQWTLSLYKHKSNIKEAIFELGSSHLFWNQPYKGVLESVKSAKSTIS